MFRQLISIFLLFSTARAVLGQSLYLEKKIDSLITASTKKPFNGVILFSQKNKINYTKVYGFSDLEKKTPLKLNDQFVIGSISKQITAVLVLLEMQKGHLKLSDPISLYLPQLTEKWADSVIVHQLLTHTHGITALDEPLAFSAGTQFLYSQLGYELLAKIIENTSGKSFAFLSGDLFKKCKMNNTFHPDTHQYKNLSSGYTEQPDGSLRLEKESLNNYVPAGSFISTAKDLNTWNYHLHNGKILADSLYQKMITKQKYATRQHPIFGNTDYGYGITIDEKENILQVGQTGLAPGFVSMDFFFPETKTSIIVLDNVTWNTSNIKQTFYYHIEILNIARENLQILQKK